MQHWCQPQLTYTCLTYHACASIQWKNLINSHAKFSALLIVATWCCTRVLKDRWPSMPWILLHTICALNLIRITCKTLKCTQCMRMKFGCKWISRNGYCIECTRSLLKPLKIEDFHFTENFNEWKYVNLNFKKSKFQLFH